MYINRLSKMADVSFRCTRKFDRSGEPKSQRSCGANSSPSCYKTTGGAAPKQGRTLILLLCLLHQWLSHHSLNKYSIIRVVHFNNTKELCRNSCKYALPFQD